MQREDGYSYTTQEEAVAIAKRHREYARAKGLSEFPWYVQRRGPENFTVGPTEYRSHKTVAVIGTLAA